MARRSRQDLLAEFHRLSDVFDTAFEVLCRMEPEWREFGVQTLRAEMLSWVDDGRATLSEALGGVRDALNDLAPRGSPHPDEAASEARFLELYKEMSGRDFWSDWPKPSAQIRAIRARGHIADDTEVQLVIDRLSDVDDKSGPKPKERADLEGLMAAYEEQASPGAI